MTTAEELPKLPEGQDSYAGIPKAVFVVSNIMNFTLESNLFGNIF